LSGSYIQQRGPKSFALYAYAGLNPITHRPIKKYLSTHTTRREARRAQAELAHHPMYSASVGPAGSTRLRLEPYVQAWIDERVALGRLRRHVADDYKARARLNLFPFLGHVPVARISPPMVQALYTRLLTEGRQPPKRTRDLETSNDKETQAINRRLAPSTVMQIASLLHIVLEDAVRKGLILKNPASQCTPPRVPQRKHVDLWTPEQITAYLTDAERTATPSVYAFYCMILGTSARLGEVAGAPETAVDFRRARFRVQVNLVSPGQHPVFGEPKTEAGARTITISEPLVEIIRGALRWKHAQRLRLGPRFRDGGTLFCTPSGRPLDLRVLRARDHLKRVERLHLPKVTIYNLKHHSVSYSLASGVDARTAADRAGNKDLGHFLRRYSFQVQEAERRAAEVATNLLPKSGHSEQ
jgi:hypothetical protein